jgi:hypothetical protein
MNIITIIQDTHVPSAVPTTRCPYPSPEFNAVLLSDAIDFLIANPSKSLEDYMARLNKQVIAQSHKYN